MKKLRVFQIETAKIIRVFCLPCGPHVALRVGKTIANWPRFRGKKTRQMEGKIKDGNDCKDSGFFSSQKLFPHFAFLRNVVGPALCNLLLALAIHSTPFHSHGKFPVAISFPGAPVGGPSVGLR